MSQFDKLLRQIRNLDKNMRFDELRKVLEHYGYTMSGPSSGSSHKNEPIKRVYIEMVKEIVESEEDNGQNS